MTKKRTYLVAVGVQKKCVLQLPSIKPQLIFSFMAREYTASEAAVLTAYVKNTAHFLHRDTTAVVNASKQNISRGYRFVWSKTDSYYHREVSGTMIYNR